MSSSLSIAPRMLAAMGAMLMASLALAQPPDAPQPGHRRTPQLTLQAQAVAQVQQDTVTITLATEHSAADQAEVGKKLTEVLDAAMPVAKSVDMVRARSGSYRVWAVTNRDGKVTGWRGRAEILLESKALAQAAELASKLSDTLPVSRISFSLSNEARTEQERKLLVEAAQAFRDRALAAASAFGFKRYQIRTLDLGGAGAVYTQSRAALSHAPVASAPAPRADMPLEPDMVSVAVQISGTVYLQ